MNKNPQIFWTIFLLVLVGLIWGFFYFKGGESKKVIENPLSSEDKKTEQLTLGEGQNVESASLDQNKYAHTILGFSFEYPKEYKISSFGNFYDSNGETILLQSEKQSIQIIITPFDEDISLTVKRIKKDLPTLSVLDEKVIQIGQGETSTQVVLFSSNNNLSVGKSIEGWFVYRNNLYQISSPENSRDLFDTIIKSWKLQE